MQRSWWWHVVGTAAVLCLFLVPGAGAQNDAPILRMELGTHTAGIYTMAMDPANRILVTGSEDKTVRVWDIANHAKLLRILRPPVGEWEQGHIFAVALAPDGRTIACGGRTGKPKEGDACIYLFDRENGALLRRLGGLPGWIQHLAYTADGRFLAALTGEGGGQADWSSLSLFRLPDYQLAAQDRDYGNFTRWIASGPGGTLLATSCLDGFVRLYDLAALKSDPSPSAQTLAPVAQFRPPGGASPWGLAFSPDGRHLAVGSIKSPTIDVLAVRDNALSLAYTLKTQSGPGKKNLDLRTVAWSSDGRFLYAGGTYRDKKIFQIRKWSAGGQGAPRDLPLGVELSVQGVLPRKAGGVVYAAHDGTFGMIDAQDTDVLLSPKAIPIYAGTLEGFRLSPDGAVIQFAYEKRGQSPALFDVNQRQLTDAASHLWAGLKAGFTLQAPITEGLTIRDWQSSLAPTLDGRPLPLKQETAHSLAIHPDRTTFLLGTNRALWLFDGAGNVQWRVRTPANVWSVNTNGQIAAAAMGDGTIRWYRLTDGEEVLAFFPHPDRKRWILWTPSGYYDASQGGEDFIGWHVNNGPEQAADFFPVSRFRAAFNRPDVIDRVLATLDEPKALQMANADTGRREVSASVQESLPPVVTVLSPADGAEVGTPAIAVHYGIRSPEPITVLKVLIDGRPVFEQGADRPIAASGELSVTIPPRDCDLSLIAENRSAVSVPATIRLHWRGSAPEGSFTIKPKLYVLAVGVSVYEDADLRLDLAAKDALDFGAAWYAQEGRLYAGVEVRTLTDAQATKGNILDGLDWLQRQTTSKDVAVLFFAGHGINDAMGDFYFLPVEADLEGLKRTGISQYDITATVASIAGKVLVFMDACHSGNLMGKTKRRGVVVVSAVVNELASAENGAVVFSSATGRQYALEDKAWGNGAFTKGVVEGLGGKADYGATGRITLNMLDLYVSERVKELTQGQQTPTTVKPPNVPDFPVAMLQ